MFIIIWSWTLFLNRLRDASDAVSSQLIDAVQSAENLKVQLNEQLSESREQLKEAFSEIRYIIKK